MKKLNGTHFPAVTICNVNQYNYSKTGGPLADDLLYILFNPLQSFNPRVLTSVVELCNNFTMETDTSILAQEIWEYMLSVEDPANFYTLLQL